MERIELYPIFNRYTEYNDYYDGELESLGDALGRDCTIAAFLPEKLDLTRQYKGDGNNGFARHPHIRIGAWRGEQPLRVEFDAKKVGEIRGKTDECYWLMGISNAEYEKIAKG